MSPHNGATKDKGGKGKGGGKDRDQDKGQSQANAGTSAAPKGAPKDRAHGPDWSHYDIESADFQKVNKLVNAYKRGDFGIMKLTEGASDVDATASEQWALVNQVEMRAAYHYHRSGQPWQAQADHFLTVIEQRNYDFHIYALDLEGKKNTFDDTFFGDARRIIDYWCQKAPDKKVMLYCNVSTYDDHVYPVIKKLYPADGAQWLDSIPLWLAWYDPDDTYPSGEGEPRTPKQRSKWDIWQYNQVGARSKDDYQKRVQKFNRPDLSDSLEFYGARDLNVFNGSKEAMKAWLGISTGPAAGQDADQEVGAA